MNGDPERDGGDAAGADRNVGVTGRPGGDDCGTGARADVLAVDG